MARRKVIAGTQMNPRNLVGKQTAARQLYQQFGLRGGLDNNGDISIQAPSEWINCTNARMPFLGASNFGAIISTFPPQSMLNNGGGYEIGSSNITYLRQPSFLTLAALQNSSFPAETYTFGGNATLVESISSASTNLVTGCGIFFEMTPASGGQTGTVEIVPPNPIDISTWITKLPVIAIDLYFNQIASILQSGFLRIGSDSNNYYQFPLTASDFKFARDYYTLTKVAWNKGVATGSPVLTSINYIFISLTTPTETGSEYTLSNVRLTNFNSDNFNNQIFPELGANISYAYPYETQNSIPYASALIAVINGTIFSNLPLNSYEGLGTPSDVSSTLTAIMTGFTIGAKYNFSNYSSAENENTLYFVNGADGVFSYNLSYNPYGQNFNQISTTPFKYLAMYQNYMWYAGDPANPNTITPSILGTPGTLDTSNAITLDNNSGQSVITGLISMDTYLIIFRNTDIIILTGSLTGSGGNIAVQPSLATTGAISQQAICRVGPYSYFYNGMGLYMFNGSYETLISSKIKFSINGVAINPNSVYLAYNPNEEAIYMFCGSDDPTVTNPIPPTDYSNFGAFIYTPLGKIFAFIGGTDDSLSVYLGGFYFNSPLDNKNYWYTYGLQILTQVDVPGYDYNIFNQNFDVQSCWNNLGSPFVKKDPATLRLFITASNPNVSGILNFYSDFVDELVYSTIFEIPEVGSSPFVDLSIGAGCQGCSFSIEVFIPNNDVAFIIDNKGDYVETNEENLVCENGDGTYNSVVYSGYGISYTESEVI